MGEVRKTPGLINGLEELATDLQQICNWLQQCYTPLQSSISKVKKALQDNGFGSLEELIGAYSQVKMGGSESKHEQHAKDDQEEDGKGRADEKEGAAMAVPEVRCLKCGEALKKGWNGWVCQGCGRVYVK